MSLFTAGLIDGVGAARGGERLGGWRELGGAGVAITGWPRGKRDAFPPAPCTPCTTTGHLKRGGVCVGGGGGIKLALSTAKLRSPKLWSRSTYSIQEEIRGK